VNIIKKKYIFFLLFLWNFYVGLSKIFIKFESIKLKKKLKILFIKPKDYINLYTEIDKNFLETIFSSIYRFGPVGLFTDFETRFLISNSNYKNDVHTDLKRKNILKKQEINSIDFEKFNFNDFDIVISFEDLIKQDYIDKNKKTIWAIMYEDHNNKFYKKNIFFKHKKYDLVFNQTLGFTPYSFFRRKHWIDFSYSFGNSNFLAKCKLNFKKDLDIIVEVNQKDNIKNLIKKEINLKYFLLDESLSFFDYVKILARGNFFLSIDCKSPRWGNSLLEAAMCNNLIIGNKNHFWNSQIILEELHVVNFDDAIILINRLKNNRKLYLKMLYKQNQILDQLNFIKPLNQIIQFALKSNRKLNILDKISL